MASSFLQEDNGNQSCMRLMCCVSLLASIVFGLLVTLGKAGPDGITIVIAFLLGAFAPKAVQKFAEAKVTGMAKP